MFGISATELIVILGLALIIFGPQKLPEIASSLGKLFGNLQKHSNELRREFYNSVYNPSEEFRKNFNETGRQLKTEAQSILSDDKTSQNPLVETEDKNNK